MALAVGLAGLPREAHGEPVSAPPAADETEAMQKFEEAERRYAAADYAGAIALLHELLRDNDDAVLHYNLGRAHEGVGAREDAIRDYERYLERAPDAPDVGVVRARIRKLQADIDAAAAAAVAVAEPEPVRAPPTEDHAASRVPAYVPWVVFGVGGAGLVVGGVFGLLARRSEGDADDARVQTDALAAQDRAERQALGANISLAAGGVIATTGLVWGIVSSVARRRGSSSARVRPWGLGLTGRF
jgi:tetratricopeptide (TPR) repeat protein